MNMVKKIGTIILFLFGTLMFAVGINLIVHGSVGAGIFGIVIAIGAFVYPALKLREYIAFNKGSGKKWMALPAVAISVPLLFSTCMASVNMDDKNKDTLSSEQTTEVSVSKLETSAEEETTTLSFTPTPLPSETTIPSSESVPVEITEETTTVKETTVKETTVKETTKQTTAATSQTETTSLPETSSEPESSPTMEETTVPTTEQETKASSEEHDYVANKRSKVFHYSWCDSVKKMADKNKLEKHCTRDELINSGYKACENCNP